MDDAVFQTDLLLSVTPLLFLTLGVNRKGNSKTGMKLSTPLTVRKIRMNRCFLNGYTDTKRRESTLF